MNSNRQMLLVRKRGTAAFMQPGGKIDEGETPMRALKRELIEELNLDLSDDAFCLLGEFEAVAANEADSIVNAIVYRIDHEGPFEPAAELDAATWYPGKDTTTLELAPLTRDHILPATGVTS